jgi:hypothetical protein
MAPNATFRNIASPAGWGVNLSPCHVRLHVRCLSSCRRRSRLRIRAPRGSIAAVDEFAGPVHRPTTCPTEQPARGCLNPQSRCPKLCAMVHTPRAQDVAVTRKPLPAASGGRLECCAPPHTPPHPTHPSPTAQPRHRGGGGKGHQGQERRIRRCYSRRRPTQGKTRSGQGRVQNDGSRLKTASNAGIRYWLAQSARLLPQSVSVQRLPLRDVLPVASS